MYGKVIKLRHRMLVYLKFITIINTTNRSLTTLKNRIESYSLQLMN
nr:MAG TPA: hypothetical protein [Crassvirales sp.]